VVGCNRFAEVCEKARDRFDFGGVRRTPLAALEEIQHPALAAPIAAGLPRTTSTTPWVFVWWCP
jgi:hypothetical protein